MRTHELTCPRFCTSGCERVYFADRSPRQFNALKIDQLPPLPAKQLPIRFTSASLTCCSEDYAKRFFIVERPHWSGDGPQTSYFAALPQREPITKKREGLSPERISSTKCKLLSRNCGSPITGFSYLSNPGRYLKNVWPSSSTSLCRYARSFRNLSPQPKERPKRKAPVRSSAATHTALWLRREPFQFCALHFDFLFLSTRKRSGS